MGSRIKCWYRRSRRRPGNRNCFVGRTDLLQRLLREVVDRAGYIFRDRGSMRTARFIILMGGFLAVAASCGTERGDSIGDGAQQQAKTEPSLTPRPGTTSITITAPETRQSTAKAPEFSEFEPCRRDVNASASRGLVSEELGTLVDQIRGVRHKLWIEPNVLGLVVDETFDREATLPLDPAISVQLLPSCVSARDLTALQELHVWAASRSVGVSVSYLASDVVLVTTDGDLDELKAQIAELVPNLEIGVDVTVAEGSSEAA
jgi:hypothetical protein